MAKLKREPSDYLKINKKKTKVSVTGTPKLLGLTGVLVQTGLPFAYLSVRYDLFTFRDAGYALTGWGVVALFGAFLIFRDKIKDAMKEGRHFIRNYLSAFQVSQSRWLFYPIVGCFDKLFR